MRRYLMSTALFLLPLCLAACEGTIYAVRNAEATASRRIAAFSDRMNPQPQQLKRPADSRYCYMTMGDVVCYRDPLPGQDTRLVGYQEPLVPVDATGIITAPHEIRSETPVAAVGEVTPAVVSTSRNPKLDTVSVPTAPSVRSDPSQPMALN